MSEGGAQRLAPLGYATPLLSTMLLLATGSPATATTLVGIFLVLVCSIAVLATQRGRTTPAQASGAMNNLAPATRRAEVPDEGPIRP
jgi:drug/metabolite transporter (DMT)-like permease